MSRARSTHLTGLLLLAAVASLAPACVDGAEDQGAPSAETPTTTSSGDLCQDIDEITGKIYVCYVIHSEEDDANGVASSQLGIPDYNDDPAVFDHFADAMLDYAQMLAGYGATLSFQPDWTFTQGVERYRPDFYSDLLALQTVEVVPHAHETVVAYDELYDWLDRLDAQPEPILGGMVFDAYITRQAWFEQHPGFSFWGGPVATVGHVDDKPAPPLAYRIPMPAEVESPEDLYRHVAASPLIVTFGLGGDPASWVDRKPAGRYLTPAYRFHAMREFLAEPDDTAVPVQWRKDTDGSSPHFGDNLTAAELIAERQRELDEVFVPLVEQGLVEFTTVGDLVGLYRQYESCLDLADGDDLSSFVPNAR